MGSGGDQMALLSSKDPENGRLEFILGCSVCWGIDDSAGIARGWEKWELKGQRW